MSSFAAVVVYDDPECAAAAEAFADLSKRLPSAPENVTTEVFLVPAANNNSNNSNTGSSSSSAANSSSTTGPPSHGDALLDALRGLVNYRPTELVVIGLLKDSNASVACQRIREICNETRPPITECHLATHLANFGDVGLVVRNLVRRFHEAASKGQTQQQQQQAKSQ